jgi:aminoglycoside phosphotransferase (APT) family kinase protein
MRARLAHGASMSLPQLRCPHCSAALREREPGVLACGAWGHTFGTLRGIPDLRAAPSATEGWPVGREALERALERLAAGTPWKSALEELLLELGEPSADRTMQLLRESRGAWIPLLAASSGRALFAGNALSGTALALARCGIDVVLLDADPLRLALALARAAALAPGTTTACCGGDGESLPFDDRAFDVAVQEEGASPSSRGWKRTLEELRRVARGEVALVAQNRLGYKSNDLRRGSFRVPRPLEYVGRALRPRGGERTLAGYRRLAGSGARSFALYPHSDDFSHVVGLDGDGPALTVGPKERTNRLKVAAERAGLFPLLAPSFLVLTSRSGGRTRIERVLGALAERTGEPCGRIETLIATRGQTAVVLTSAASRDPEDPRGRWCLHVPLCPAQEVQVERHIRVLRLIRERYSGVPVPEPLHWGRLEGLPVACERRLGGLTAPQITGAIERTDRMLGEVAARLGELAVEPAAPCGEQRFEELIGRRFALVARHARVESTLREVERLRARAREALLGRSFPLVVMHQDLRGKHVQVSEDGALIGLLDWGTADERGLPYADLLHLLVHERKQAEHLTAGEAWRLVLDGKTLRPAERAALDAYRSALGLDAETCAAICSIYPVLVAAMAESHWDYSRPRWLHEQFGV